MKINKYSDFMKLKIVHIFDYYDIPLFFISMSPKGEYFLNYYIDEIEDNTDKWLFSRISNKERINLIEQRLSALDLLNHLFKKERLYHLFINPLLKDSNATLKSELVNIDNFDPESFPEEDFYVEYDYVTKSNLVKVEEEVLDSSKFKVVLKDSRNSHDISLDLFLDFLSNVKKSLNDIANDIGNKLIGRESNHSINLRVDSLQPSSFGVWLRTEPTEADLFEVPEKSLNNLFEIIEDISLKNQEEIQEQVEIDENYSLITIKNIKNMLKDISDNNFSLTLEGTTKTNYHTKEVKFDKNSYNKLDILTEILKKHSTETTERIEIEGLLTSVNTTSYNHFRISTTTHGDMAGKISKDLMKMLKDNNNLQFRVPSHIKATIEKKIVNNLVEDDYSDKNTLIAFKQPE